MLNIKFRFSPNHKDSYKTPGIMNIVFIDLTSRCNLNCKYCFNADSVNGKSHDLPVSLIEKMLADENASKIPNWIFSGGEPLLYPHLDKALDLFRQKKIGPKIVTNGTLLSPDVTDKWISYGVAATQVSIDTLNKDKFVLLNSRNPELLDKTLTNLDYAIKSPLRVVVGSVLTKLNLEDILTLMPYFYNIGIDSYTVYLFTPGSNLSAMENHIMEFSEIPGIIDTLIEKYYSICNTRIIDTDIFQIKNSEMFGKWNSKLDLRIHGCSAGQFSLSIKTNGKVSPCICQDAPEFICGDLNKSNMSEIWNSQEVISFRNSYQQIPECKGCEHLINCHAGCRNNAFLFGNKGLYSLDPICESFRQYKLSSSYVNL